MDTAPIAIYQFLPNPTNEDEEWIELENKSSESVDLSGFILDDEPDAGSKPYKIPDGRLLVANVKLKFPKSETKIALNNSKQKDQPFADIVRLLSKDGAVLDSISYVSTSTDQPIGHTSPTSVPSTPVPTLPPSPTPQTDTPTTKPVLVLAASTQKITTPSLVPSKYPTPTFLPTPTPIPTSAHEPRVLSFLLVGCGIITMLVAGFLAAAKLKRI